MIKIKVILRDGSEYEGVTASTNPLEDLEKDGKIRIMMGCQGLTFVKSEIRKIWDGVKLIDYSGSLL